MEAAMSRRRLAGLFGSLLLLAAGVECARPGGDVAGADGALGVGKTAKPGTHLYENRDANFRVAYPAVWTSRTDPRNVLTVGPAVSSDGEQELTAELGIAVPKLPFHLPGIVPLGEVEKGYVEDLKKQYSGVKTAKSADVKFPDAAARRFVVTATSKAGPRTFDVLAVYRASTDKLYVVTSGAPTADAQTATAVMEQVVSSWQWIK
jgi:hypothetical protein